MKKENRVIIESPNWDPGEFENIDIHININERQFHGVLITIEGIRNLMNNFKSSGECLNGSYFYANNMLVVESLEETHVYSCICDLNERGEIDSIFECTE